MSSDRVNDLSPLALENLRASGLTDEYIKLMRLKPYNNDKEGRHDYVIPYFDIKGVMLRDFYRIRILRDKPPGKDTPKYIQPPDSPNRVWIPPNWSKDLADKPYLIITEGEKKAAAAAQYGIPVIALGGVDSWRSRRYTVPLDKLKKGKDPDKVILDLKESEIEMLQEQVAEEMYTISRLIAEDPKPVYIVFDSDSADGLKDDVQRAAFDLAIWLDSQGVEDTRLAVLPSAADKTGLDDFIVAHGAQALEEFLLTEEHSFPTHPSPKRWVRKLMSAQRLTRNASSSIARAVIASLDRNGKRFVDPAGRFYYFDAKSKVLHMFNLGTQDLRNFRLDTFGSFLYQTFGIGTSDGALLSRIADSFVTTAGIRAAQPRRVLHTTDEAMYYQLSDSRMAKVTADDIRVVDNGTDDVLFLAGQVDPITKQLRWSESEEPRWMTILRRTSVQEMEGMTLRETHILLTCLFYLNPWLRRWKGLMLPIELAIAEPNSGKSFLYNLRAAILTGHPTLRHAPSSVRDWYADLASTPAMWIGDNFGRLPGTLRNSMSDEFARLITDPSPSVSLRKLYTTAENTRLPVDCTFAITAINNPFTKEDIMQRSIVISMKAVPRGERDGAWYSREIEDGGRERWVAEHLVMAKRFLSRARERWDDNYLSSHRLVNFEQSLVVMGEVLGYGDEIVEIVDKLTDTVQENIAQFNPVIEALRGFVRFRQQTDALDGIFQASDIVEWATSTFDFTHVQVIQDARQLGRYIAAHEYDIRQSTGIYKVEGMRDGKHKYALDLKRVKKFMDI